MKDTILTSIQETIIQYAKIISEITQAQVEIMDRNYIRIAATGSYASNIGKEMEASSKVCQQVLKTSKSLIVSNPGQHPVCINCPDREHCIEKLIIASPINLNGEIIGAISLFAVNMKERSVLLQKIDIYQHFVEQIADFISIKAKECNEEQINRMYIQTLDSIVDNIEQCVIVLRPDRSVTSINSSTKKHLRLDDSCIGEYLDLKSTGDDIHGENEYRMKIMDKEYFIIGQLHQLYIGTQSSVQILIFKEKNQLKTNTYNFTGDFGIWEIDDIIGGSASTERLKYDIKRIAKSDSTVLISGESGTGKELVATAIWKASRRRNEIFVPINCAAIPDTLLESELFGYVKGAFTGANPKGRIGKFELAGNGILFLDEIGDMPIYLQAKLLRVLQEQQITRIGSNNKIKINVRIISATNQDLIELIRKNKFREDLYYRLNVIPIKITPLRERSEDILDLINLFIKKYANKFNKYYSRINDDTLEILTKYEWPGNVRELENAIEYMINMMDDDGVLDNTTLPDSLGSNLIMTSVSPDRTSPVRRLKDIERLEIEKALDLYGKTTSGKKNAAKSLGIAVSTLYRKLEQG